MGGGQRPDAGRLGKLRLSEQPRASPQAPNDPHDFAQWGRSGHRRRAVPFPGHRPEWRPVRRLLRALPRGRLPSASRGGPGGKRPAVTLTAGADLVTGSGPWVRLACPLAAGARGRHQAEPHPRPAAVLPFLLRGHPDPPRPPPNSLNRTPQHPGPTRLGSPPPWGSPSCHGAPFNHHERHRPLPQVPCSTRPLLPPPIRRGVGERLSYRGP